MVGGAEEMVLNLVRHLPPRFEPTVACIHEAGPIGEEIRRPACRFHVLGLTPGLRRPLDVLRLRDALHGVGSRPSCTPFCSPAASTGASPRCWRGVPIVIGTEVNIYEHKQPLHRAGRAVADARHRRGDRLGRIGARASTSSRSHADPDKVDVIYNAVDWSQLADDDDA